MKLKIQLEQSVQILLQAQAVQILLEFALNFDSKNKNENARSK